MMSVLEITKFLSDMDSALSDGIFNGRDWVWAPIRDKRERLILNILSDCPHWRRKSDDSLLSTQPELSSKLTLLEYGVLEVFKKFEHQIIGYYLENQDKRLQNISLAPKRFSLIGLSSYNVYVCTPNDEVTISEMTDESPITLVDGHKLSVDLGKVLHEGIVNQVDLIPAE